MLIFWKNTITNFDSKKLLIYATQDGSDFLQVASQKRDAFLKRIESSSLNRKLKERFRKECEFALDKDNPLDKLHNLEKQFENYQEFILKTKTDFWFERDGFLSGDINGYPLWGGEMVSNESETIPREAMEEKMFWLDEFVEKLYEKQIDPRKIDTNALGEMKQKMSMRMRKIKAEAQKRKKQIFEFENARNNFPTLAQRYKKLFSPKLFTQATFEERRNILFRIAKQIRILDQDNSFPALREKEFENEMRGKIREANKLPLSFAWETLKNEANKFGNPHRELRGLPIFQKWKGLLEAEVKKYKIKIEKRVNRIRKNLIKKRKTESWQKDWEYVKNLSPQFKIDNSLIDVELKLWEKTHNPQVQEAEIASVSPRESLLIAQQNNEFVRRIFIQICALAMAFGKNTSTTNKTQQKLVKDDLVDRETLATSEEANVKRDVAQQTSRNLDSVETFKGSVDTLSAVEDSGEEALRFRKREGGVEGSIKKEAQVENKVDSWEMTRLIGINAWPPQQLEDYLRGVKHAKHHLEITHNYLPVSFLYAATLLKQRIAANLEELPGENAQGKRSHQRAFFDWVDAAATADDRFTEEIFSYTSNI